MKITDIVWDTYGYYGPDVHLPDEVDVPDDLEEDEISDYLSDKYEFLIKSFVIEPCVKNEDR